ncbi:MAG: tRNA (guanosine(37)-N1)-methyltransferase TrmD, partial [Dehalococcoidia bacterium]|nr:tRNA (guanosine(37)-N1)-methyltransferase TrmD [Dehalococcoidia bacterium]
SITGRAQERGVVRIVLHDLRDYSTDRHRAVDDSPYGGGPGMVMKPEPFFAAVEAIRAEAEAEAAPFPVILLSPQGQPFTQAVAQELASLPRFLLLSGRYEGVDERVREHLATRELSLGDFVLSGGEPAAWAVIDAVVRLLPGAVGSPESLESESHAQGLLEYPQYTRPPEFRGWQVPEILLSGDHGAIARWRRRQSLSRTQERRPDLLAKAPLTERERRELGLP